jgi:cell volume regulation protein A
MDSVALFLLSVAGIFLIGAVGEIIFQRTNIPDVIWLILAGILLGPVSGLVTKPRLNAIAPYFAAITLVIVLFEGGTALRLRQLSKSAPRSGALALISFLSSTAMMAAVSMLAAWVGWLPESWTWTHGWLLGAILGGSSSIIVMPAMQQARVAPRVANMVNLESALTDALCVVGTVAIIDVMVKGSTGAAGPAVALARSFGIGLAIGLVAGLIWLLFLKFLRDSEHAYPITLSALLVLYVVIDKMGGSAALGILAVAVILGNAPSLSRKIGLIERVQLDTSVRGFHRQMTFIIKSFFFVFIGAMLDGPIKLLLLGTILGGLLFAARIPSARLAMVASGMSADEKNLVTVAMPRGMAAGVLATLPVSAGIPGTESLPVVVFACVLVTILVFAIGFPVVKRGMQPVEPEPLSEELSVTAPPVAELGPAAPAPAPAQPSAPVAQPAPEPVTQPVAQYPGAPVTQPVAQQPAGPSGSPSQGTSQGRAPDQQTGNPTPLGVVSPTGPGPTERS